MTNFKCLKLCLGVIQLDSCIFSLGDIVDGTDFLVTIIHMQKEISSMLSSDCALHHKFVGNL